MNCNENICVYILKPYYNLTWLIKGKGYQKLQRFQLFLSTYKHKINSSCVTGRHLNVTRGISVKN